MYDNLNMKQILLITDGCSNKGDDPVQIARVAKTQGIAVNVIGIVDGGDLNSAGRQEVQEIAEAGGGLSRIVEARQLAMTMQMVTKHTVQMTIQQVVNKELQQMLGTDSEGLPPQKRGDVAEMVERMSDEAALQLALVIDTSASMIDKLPTVREAIRDLQIGLDVRQGQHQVAILTFPASRQQDVQVVSDFSATPDLSSFSSQLQAGGSTPTGPALQAALGLFAGAKSKSKSATQHQQTVLPPKQEDEHDGDMAAYVV
ncbi:MAG TPA: VWA domain-containing protein [Bacilli bacterium]|nr:VWA domain-containing protein [Bacilli bacterium]